MESSAIGRCIPQKSSRKRVFPGGSSPMESDSSSPSNNQTFICKNKMRKQNEDVIISPAINDVLQIDSEDDVLDSHHGKYYIDLCSDDYVSEDDSSDFDDIDIPTEIEASDPLFLDSNKLTSPTGFVQSTHLDHASDRKNKGIKTSGGSSSFGFSSLQLQKGVMKVRSIKKLLFKPRSHKMSSGPGGSSSNTRLVDQQDVTNHGEIIPMGDVTLDQDSGENEKSLNVAGSSSRTRQLGNDEEVLRKYRNFKNFDIVDDHSDHHYSSKSATAEPPRNWAKKIQEEWRILEKDLPDTIFVRVYESRMDLLRAVIMGAEGTPYHDGLFFFDVCFPKDYPHAPPQVYYHSGGLRINPNLYKNGKVCLSLLNTWIGLKNETWRPESSTMLQVLVSIQGLILNEKPYFNEPGFEETIGSAYGENQSQLYNERTIILSLKTMVYTMKKPPKHFEDMVIGHFRDRAHGILKICKAYSKGVGFGWVVEEGKGSRGFENDVERYMKTLIGAFKEIGVEDVEGFVPPSKNLSQKIKAFFGI